MSGVALVTGAARGIGAATVARLVSEGWRVVALDSARDDPRLGYGLATPGQLEALAIPGQVATVRGDTASAADVDRAVATAVEAFGGLDAAVCAAGVIAGGVLLWEADGAGIDALVEVNLVGVITVARRALPTILEHAERGRGRFVAVSSAAAVAGMPGLAAYGATKAGVEALVRALAAELRGTGATANAVRPGSTRTDILTESARLYGLEDPERFARQQPLGRLIEPAEIAAAVAWLLGPDAAAVTGTAITVDGGLTL